MVNSERLNLIATATFGLEAVVARELEQLGYVPQIAEGGRVRFQADAQAIARTNLWLRASDRVLIEVGRFAATDFGQLFDRTRDLPWERFVEPAAAFPVGGRSIRSQLSSVPACQKIVKKAIVERLRSAHQCRELPERGAKVQIEVALLSDQVTLSIDTTGPGLHKRGYRRRVGRAPLKETLAAAMVLLSFWRRDRPLIDPFCGTGTICIEAAMLGRNIAPGLHRSFAAEAWSWLPEAHWADARREARGVALDRIDGRILGTDVDERALEMARANAERAGVAGDIHFQKRPFDELLSKWPYGCVITNPPYGVRLEDTRKLGPLYRTMPGVFARLKTWSFYVLTAFPDYEQVMGQEADRRRKLYNGRIECTYYQFHGPRPPREGRAADDSTRGSGAGTTDGAAAPAFGGLSEKAHEQAELLHNRLAKRARHLRKWPERGISCYRVYERDIPEIPLVIDRYGDHLHVAEYPRPHDRTPAEHADWLELMLKTAGAIFEIHRSRIFLKQRGRQRGDAQYERLGDHSHTMVVQERDLKFRVNLSDYVDTGLFLDHRETRRMVREEASGKRFLNLFAYTAAFSVYAAAGGAAATTTVDWSNTYLDWAAENMRLNGFDGPAHRFCRDSAVNYLRQATERLERGGPDRSGLFDIAVVDPPTYSNSKRTEEDWDVQRDHVTLLSALLRLMSGDAVVYFSTNYRRFKFDQSSLSGAVEAEGASLSVHEISRQTVPEDFRNKRVHRCWRIHKLDPGAPRE